MAVNVLILYVCNVYSSFIAELPSFGLSFSFIVTGNRHLFWNWIPE